MRLAALALCLVAGLGGSGSARALELAPAPGGPYTLELVDEAGRERPTFSHGGRTYVLGALGQRYLIRVRNQTGRRVEAVLSVDGRDVLDGQPSAWSKRGYLVEPYGAVTIDGYRLSADAVAAFRFAPVPRSYAALEGDARDVGVVGVAIFPERGPPRERAKVRLRSEAAPAPSTGAEAPSAAGALADAEARRRRGLGTEFGEEHPSHVDRVPFERAGERPQAVLTLRYDDRAGLQAVGVDVDRQGDEVEVRRLAEPFRRDPAYARPPAGWCRRGGR